MNKNFKYLFVCCLLSFVFFALHTSCKKQDKFPGQTLPDIITVNPTSAIPGSPVNIKGKHLNNITKVRFGIVEAVFNIASDTIISAIVPDSLPPGNLYVQVYVGDGVAYAAQKFTILEAPKIPVIFKVDPATAFPGDNITITGINFTAVNVITFGSVAAVYTISDSTKLNVTVPANLIASNQLITVSAPAGSDTISFKVNLAPVITSFTPVKAKQGDVVIVTGKRFTGTSSVLLGNLPSSFIVINDTSLNLTIPSNAVSGLITVTTPNGSAVSSNSLEVY
jgi:hypothetical protein